MGNYDRNYKECLVRDDVVDNLAISWDDSEGFVLLYTPRMSNMIEHHHINLTIDQANALREFLNDLIV